MPPKKDKGRGGQAAAPQAQPAAPAQQPEDQCVLCGGHIDQRAEQRLSATCNLCGTAWMHFDCAVDYLDQCLPSLSSNSAALRKYEALVKQRPKYFYTAEKVPCPAGSGRAKREGPSAGCAGFTIGAEIYKPAKAPPAPVPQPARPAKQQQQQAAAGKKAAAPTGGVTLGRKFRYSAGSSARSNPQPFGAAATSTGSGQPPGRPPPFAPASAGGGGGSFFKGPRPPELTLCREVSEAGRCYIHNCRFAHSEAELRQREEDYAAERAARKQQAREAEAAAQRAAAQRALEEAAAAQAVLDAIEEREMLLGITQPTLALVKSHKRAACLHTLLAYGFNEPEAENAVEAAGADQRLATQMLFNQEPCAGFQPVIVDREVQDLIAFAAELGLPSPLQAVEDQLAAANGNWEAAHEALQALALESAVAASSSAAATDAGSWGAGDWAAPPTTLPPSEIGEPGGGFPSSQPGTPSPAAAAPHWATEAHSAGGASASPVAHSPHLPASEAASDSGGGWHQPSSAAGSTVVTPTAAASPRNGAFGEPPPQWQAHPPPQLPLPQLVHQQHGSPAPAPAGFEGFMPASQHMMPALAPFGSPVPLPGTLQPPPGAAPAGPMPAAAYPALPPPAGCPSEYAHGFQAGLAAAMRQLQQAQQAQQFAPQAPPYAQHQHQAAHAQPEQPQHLYGQLQQPYSQAPSAAQQQYEQQQQYGSPRGHGVFHQQPSLAASHGPPTALAPDAFFPAAQPHSWQQQQQSVAQPASPHYQQARAGPFQQVPTDMAYPPSPQPGQAQLLPQQAQQDDDDLDAILSLMGIG